MVYFRIIIKQTRRFIATIRRSIVSCFKMYFSQKKNFTVVPLILVNCLNLFNKICKKRKLIELIPKLYISQKL